MKLNQITLPCKDISATKDFYLTLGFTLIVDTEHYLRFANLGDNNTFSFVLTDEPLDNAAVIYFEIEDLDGQVERIKKRGVKFEHDPIDQRYLWREALLRDPSGNKIKLYWAGENRLNPPWRVS